MSLFETVDGLARQDSFTSTIGSLTLFTSSKQNNVLWVGPEDIHFVDVLLLTFLLA